MTTLLTFIGIIAIFIFGKFIYDTFLTNRTEEDWNQYKQTNPESAARIERNKGLDFSIKPKSQEQDKRDTLLRMAKNIGCSPAHVKENFINGLNEQRLTAMQTKEAIQLFRKNKYEESKVFNIDPDDTASAYMEEWTKEYWNNKEYADRKRTGSEVAEDFLTENPEADRIVKSGDKTQLYDFLDKNTDLMDSMSEELSFADKPGEKYHNRALDKMFDDKDFTGAIQLINKGLEFDEPETEPFLYKLRADCKQKLLNFNDALIDLDKAIESILKNSPDNYYSISNLLKERGKIKQKLGDTLGANQDREIAAEYFAKNEATKTHDNDSDDDDLPF